jgi:hypothetical protein
MKRIITVTFAAATLLVGGLALAHDSNATGDAKGSCAMKAKSDAKGEAHAAKADGKDCCAKKADAKTADGTAASKDAKHCDMKAKDAKHAEHHAKDAKHADHHAKDAKAADHGSCDMKTKHAEGKDCCDEHKKAAAPETARPAAEAPAKAS